ncbi:MAG: hypothetical protein QXZ63_03075 [Sulfolobales archaeon]
MSKWLRKGQAEIIGGLMVASVLLLIIIPLILNTMTSSTTVGTRNYILRSQFEIERWSEKLVINGTKIVNPSPVEITIVRIWDTNGTPIDISPKNLLAGGGTIDITELYSGITSIHDLDALVTARGRVFKIEELIPPTPGGEGGEEGGLPLGLTGGEIVGGSYIFDYNITIIKCIYGGSPCGDAIPAIYHNNTWYVYKDGWGTATSKGINIDLNQAAKYIDMDKNHAPELIVLRRYDNTHYVVFTATDQKDYMYSVKFSRYIRIEDNTTLISAFLKVVTVSTAEAELSTFIETILSNSNNNAINMSNYGSLSKVRFPKDVFNVTVYEGYILFPIKQFGYFSSIISNYPGYYDVIVNIYLKPSSSNVDMSSGIEYIAVTAAYPD